MKDEEQYCGMTYGGMPQMCETVAYSMESNWLRITGLLKIEGQHVRKG